MGINIKTIFELFDDEQITNLDKMKIDLANMINKFSAEDMYDIVSCLENGSMGLPESFYTCKKCGKDNEECDILYCKKRFLNYCEEVYDEEMHI